MSQQLAEITAPAYHRDYSAEYKAEAIALVKANGGNVLRVANQLGIDETNIRTWLKHEDRYRHLTEQKSIELVTKLDRSAHELADALQGKIADASLAQTATALGIVIDKSQLLKNLPTSISLSTGRTELTVALADSLADVIDITPEPE